MKTVTYDVYVPWGQDRAVCARLVYRRVAIKQETVPSSYQDLSAARKNLLAWAHREGFTHVKDIRAGVTEKIHKVPKGYTAEELDRDNPFNTLTPD